MYSFLCRYDRASLVGSGSASYEVDYFRQNLQSIGLLWCVMIEYLVSSQWFMRSKFFLFFTLIRCFPYDISPKTSGIFNDCHVNISTKHYLNIWGILAMCLFSFDQPIVYAISACWWRSKDPPILWVMMLLTSVTTTETLSKGDSRKFYPANARCPAVSSWSQKKISLSLLSVKWKYLENWVSSNDVIKNDVF